MGQGAFPHSDAFNFQSYTTDFFQFTTGTNHRMVGGPSFSPGKVLGSGTFGSVVASQCRSTGERVAIKRSVKWKKKVSREVEMMKRFSKADNISKLHNVFYSTTPNGYIIQVS
eukprot:GHVN01057557.1.p1 GENE.GHVN01057557.1~~GHVN01057557.1.p1  ORF type:complete len:113 (+),score=6.96 GHVN01057557.1:466-804(+)